MNDLDGLLRELCGVMDKAVKRKVVSRLQGMKISTLLEKELRKFSEEAEESIMAGFTGPSSDPEK